MVVGGGSMKIGSSSAGRLDRKTVERNRRIRMKMLYSQLHALLPPPRTTRERGTMPLPDRLDETVTFIKGLQARIETMKEKKRQLLCEAAGSSRVGMTLPQIEVQDLVAGLQVIITSSPDDWFVFNEAIRVIQAEGAEIDNASFSASGDKAYHIIHSHVGQHKSGQEASKLLERLKEYIHLLFECSCS